MSHKQRIVHLLEQRQDLCDDCIAAELGISQRQTVRSICETSNDVLRIAGDVRCSACGRNKLVRRIADSHTCAPAAPKVDPEASMSAKATPVNIYSREEDLRKRFNVAVSSVLKLEAKDYYSELTFSNFVTLKGAFARIHDIVTLKLAMAMAEWIGNRFHLEPTQIMNILKRVDSTHPNASGFDIDCLEPNVIAEVKGNIPMNGGNRFGPAQLRGLDDDVFGMLGLASFGKGDDELKRKLQRPTRVGAHKFLGLIDTREIRAATSSWTNSLNRSKKMAPHGYLVMNETHSDAYRTDVVYVVYLPVIFSPDSQIEGAVP